MIQKREREGTLVGFHTLRKKERGGDYEERFSFQERGRSPLENPKRKRWHRLLLITTYMVRRGGGGKKGGGTAFTKMVKEKRS